MYFRFKRHAIALCFFCMPFMYAIELKKAPKELAISVLHSMPAFDNKDVVMGQQEWDELCCDTFVNLADRTVTSFGRWGLEKLLWPVADLHEIERRQCFIKKLVEDEAFMTQLDKLLKQVSQREKDVLAYYDEDNEFFGKIDSLYYDLFSWLSPRLNKKLNRSKWALEGVTTLGVFYNLKASGLEFLFQGFTAEYLNKLKFHAPFSFTNALKRSVSYPIRMNDMRKKECFKFKKGSVGVDLSNIDQIDPTSPRFLYDQLHEGSQCPKYIAMTIALAYLALIDVGIGLNVYRAGNSLKKTIALIGDLKKHLQAIAHVRTKLHAVCKTLDNVIGVEMRNALLGGDVCHLMASPGIKELDTLLDVKVFTSYKPTACSRGRLLLTHRLLKDKKEAFVKVLQALALIDAYVSIARLYKERHTQAACYSFPKLHINDQAAVSLNDFWAPLIDPDASVVNTLVCAHDGEPNKLVVTGPNGCGKSMAMKGVAWQVLLAQSWGIVPASFATQSLFGALKTSLNPQEDITAGLSTFMAEKSRMTAIEEFLEEKSSKPVLLLLDEPYHGTVAFEAAHRVSQFCRRWADKTACMMLIATHLENLTELEQEQPGIFANYQVGVDQDEQGNLTRSFKLEPGAASWWFTDVHKRRAFIDQLMVA